MWTCAAQWQVSGARIAQVTWAIAMSRNRGTTPVSFVLECVLPIWESLHLSQTTNFLPRLGYLVNSAKYLEIEVERLFKTCHSCTISVGVFWPESRWPDFLEHCWFGEMPKGVTGVWPVNTYGVWKQMHPNLQIHQLFHVLLRSTKITPTKTTKISVGWRPLPESKKNTHARTSSFRSRISNNNKRNETANR